MRALELLVLPVAVLLVAVLLLVAHTNRIEPEPIPPDFSAFRDVKEKKSAFFTFMLPLVRQSNAEIRSERRRLLKLVDIQSRGATLSRRDMEWLNTVAIKYRIKDEDPASSVGMERLVRRIDIVPASLALAQAANESAWGTARFARNGKNYFGIWCWREDCGLVPKRRDAGARHEVARFGSSVDSVRYYMLTLNSHPAYTEFRQLRSSARRHAEPLTGAQLAAGLLSYSERRQAYVKEIRAMIRVNQLHVFNLPEPLSGNG